MAELKFNNLPFKTFEEWENIQKDEPNNTLTALQKAISKELRRRKAEEKQAKIFEKWAATHGYELIKKKEPAKPDEKKPEAAAPFKM
jgi:ABC-type amino acid transport substrate-binding protein